MKRFAGIIALACTFAVVCFMVVGCSSAPGPKDTVESALKAITAHDYARIDNAAISNNLFCYVSSL